MFCVVWHVGDGLYAFWLLVSCRHPRNAVHVQLVRRGRARVCIRVCIRVRVWV